MVVKSLHVGVDRESSGPRTTKLLCLRCFYCSAWGIMTALTSETFRESTVFGKECLVLRKHPCLLNPCVGTYRHRAKPSPPHPSTRVKCSLITCLGIHRTWVNLIYVSRSLEWFFTETLCLASNWKQRCPTKKVGWWCINLATRKELLKISPYVLSTLGPGCSFCHGMATLLGGRKNNRASNSLIVNKAKFPCSSVLSYPHTVLSVTGFLSVRRYSAGTVVSKGADKTKKINRNEPLSPIFHVSK